MEQQQIVSAEEEVLLKCFSEQNKSVKPFPGQREVICKAMKEYTSLQNKSLTTERDEALKANDLLCKKIDQKDEEIARLKNSLDSMRYTSISWEHKSKEYLEALKELYEDTVYENNFGDMLMWGRTGGTKLSKAALKAREVIQNSQSKEQ
jgi:hypothetical protein